jgi:hypothetical protein
MLQTHLRISQIKLVSYSNYSTIVNPVSTLTFLNLLWNKFLLKKYVYIYVQRLLSCFTDYSFEGFISELAVRDSNL